MKQEDVNRIRDRMTEGWLAQDFVCAICGKAPFCPMIHDELWAKITPYPNDTPREVRDALIGDGLRKGINDLLCFECAEARLGRQLTVEDLLPCGTNYMIMVFTTRLQEDIDDLKAALRGDEL